MNEITVAIIGALAGGLASFIVNIAFPSYVTSCVLKNMSLRFTRVHGASVQCRLINGSSWPINRAIVYITIYHSHNDLLQPPPGKHAFITKHNPTDIIEDRMSWSVAFPDSNRLEIDVFPGEEQVITPFRLSEYHIEVVSEQGFAGVWKPEDSSRAFLRKQKYKGVFKVVSASAKAKTFAFELDPNDLDKALLIKPELD